MLYEVLYELSAGLPMSEWAELRTGVRVRVYTGVYAILYIDREISR